jgi:hypothetical protein
VLTDEEIFCQRCQLVLAECQCDPVSLHSLSVTDIPQSVFGDSGDSGVSPAGSDLTSADLPAVTAVTPSGDRRAKHAKSGDRNGDSPRSLSPGRQPQRRTSWTAAELLKTDFPDPKWAVPGLFPEGLTLLAGAPKVGKSFLCLGLALAVASGGRALGSISVQAGSVLYLALEDTPRRLKRRLQLMLAGDSAPECLTVAIESPTGEAGALKIATWLERDHPLPPRLVIVDVLEAFRGPAAQGASAYSADYKAISQIKTVADMFGVSVIVITHVRKISSDDFISEVSGTLGLSGAADTICSLKRSRGTEQGVLHITGRDVDEESYALTFAPDIGAWQLIGLESEHGLAENRRRILAYLRLHDGSKPAEIAIGTGLNRDLIKQTCNRMASDAQLETDGNGRYFAPPPKEI